MPRSWGLMRPSGETADASVKTSEAPPTARLPRWTRCQSFAKPSLLEYSHMGETTMRFRNVAARIWSGSNRCIMMLLWESRVLDRCHLVDELSRRGDALSSADDSPPDPAAAIYAHRPSNQNGRAGPHLLLGHPERARAPDYLSRRRH